MRLEGVAARWGRTTLVALLAGCTHAEPYTIAEWTTDAPLAPGPPALLSGSLAESPSWAPAGSGILLVIPAEWHPHDHDQCVVLLPPTGGRSAWEHCGPILGGDDSLIRFTGAAIAADGRLAVVRTAQALTGIAINTVDLLLYDSALAPSGRRIASIPRTVAGSPIHNGATGLRWLDDSTLVYLAEFVGGACFLPPPNCSPTTVRSGVGVILQPLNGPASLVDSTLWATSFDVDAGGRAIVFTRIADSRVYRMSLETGALTTVADFGPLGIARGVSAGGGRYAATVGGIAHASQGYDGSPVQVDLGGRLAVTVPGSAAKTLPDADTTAARVTALSPDGTQLLALVARRLVLYTLAP